MSNYFRLLKNSIWSDFCSLHFLFWKKEESTVKHLNNAVGHKSCLLSPVLWCIFVFPIANWLNRDNGTLQGDISSAALKDLNSKKKMFLSDTATVFFLSLSQTAFLKAQGESQRRQTDQFLHWQWSPLTIMQCSNSVSSCISAALPTSFLLSCNVPFLLTFHIYHSGLTCSHIA